MIQRDGKTCGVQDLFIPELVEFGFLQGIGFVGTTKMVGKLKEMEAGQDSNLHAVSDGNLRSIVGNRFGELSWFYQQSRAPIALPFSFEKEGSQLRYFSLPLIFEFGRFAQSLTAYS